MIIGFSGHQKIDDPGQWGWVRTQLEAAFNGKVTGGTRALTSLAEGGDQLFAETALSLGYPVDVVIPSAGYEATFSDQSGRDRYRNLLGKAASVVTLPFPSPSEEAYLAAGKYVVDRANLLVTLWNGQPAAGKGGTGDIVTYAQSLNKPIIHINPATLEVTGLAAPWPQ